MFKIYIAPHERQDAIDVYRDRLTPEQIEQIEEAHIDAEVWLYLDRTRIEVGIVEEEIQ